MTLLLADFGVSFYIGLAISIAAAAASYALSVNAANKQKKPRPDISPPNVTTQGAILPIVVGKNRIPGIVLFVGNRSAHRQGGGRDSKGKKKPVTGYVYAEDALHALCVGPATELTRIWADGKVIWTGSINPTDDPAGSVIAMPAGVAASFTIYWGGDADPPHAPASPELDDLGFDASIFPRHVLVRWNGFGLGGSPRWPTIEYEVTRLPVGGAADPCSTDTVSVTGVAGDVLSPPEDPFAVSVGASGVETISYTLTYTVADAGWYDLAALVLTLTNDSGGSGGANYAGQAVLVEMSDGSETITLLDDVFPTDPFTGIGPSDPPVVVGCWTGDYGGGSPDYYRSLARRYVELTAGVWTVTISVDVLLTSASPGFAVVECGGNIIEIESPVVTGLAQSWLHELIYADAPAGLAFGTDEIDETSVADVVAALALEGLDPPSIYLPDGEAFDGALGEWMADMGCTLRWNPATGRDEFFLVRQETEAWTVPAEACEGPPPEIESFIGDVVANQIVFSFPDAARNYRDTVIARGADGQATLMDVTRARKVQIHSAVDFDAAATIAMRRSQEELGNLVQYTFEFGRGAARIRVGERIALPDLGIDATLRVLTTQRYQDGNRTTIKAVVDSYGVPVAVHPAEDGGGTSNPAVDPTADLAFTFVEAPPALLQLAGVELPSILVLRVRANASILGAAANLSSDGTNYYDSGRDAAAQIGFQLTEAIEADDPYVIEDGPLATLLGPDVDDLQDLTADEAAWKEGRQVLVIGEEILYLRNAELISGTTYRLHGLVRARLGTARQAHAIAAKGYVGAITDAQTISDPMLRPGASIRLKSQPFTSTFLSLASITAVTKTLEGKGVAPPPVGALRVVAPVLGAPSFTTGEDVELAWCYRSQGPLVVPGSGWGLGVFGQPSGVSPAVGEFEVEIYDGTDTLVATYRGEAEGVFSTGFTYSNADLVADLGSEEDFTVSVRNVNGGLRSPAVELAVGFVT